MPALETFSENSKAPQRLKLSEIPIDCIFLSLQKFAMSLILIAPSQIEYSV